MRFVVRSVTGYAETGKGAPATSFSVLDSFYNYREVRKFYADYYKKGDTWRSAAAHKAAAQLNAEYSDA